MFVDMSYISTLPKMYEIKVARLGLRKGFTFHAHGKEKALELALAYRDGLYKTYKIPKLHVENEPILRLKHRANPDLLSGISINIDKRKGVHAYFVAHFFDNAYKKTRFSINKLGYEGAFRKALEHRLSYSNLDVPSPKFKTPRPTLDQFIHLIRVADDVPSPL